MTEPRRPEPLPSEEEATLLRLHGSDSTSDPEVEHLWVEEAIRRAAELGSGAVAGRPAPDVMRDARDRLP